MSTDIDMGFRPNTYFRPQKIEDYLLSSVKSPAIRKRLRAMFR